MSDVLFMADLAKKLGCSPRTIRERLTHAPHRLPPQTPSIDRRPRWHPATVDAWLQQPARTAATWGREKKGFGR